MRTPVAALAAAAATAVLVLAGCGEGEESTHVGTVEPPPADGTGPSATAQPAPCVTDAVAAFPDVGEVVLQDGRAVALGGPAYTIFAGDFDVPAEGLATTGYEAGPGEHLAFVATTVYNAGGDLPELEVGAPIAWTDDFEVLTFAVVLDSEGEQSGDNRGAGGTLTVTSLDEESICVDVDYRDAEKSVAGTIAARIV